MLRERSRPLACVAPLGDVNSIIPFFFSALRFQSFFMACCSSLVIKDSSPSSAAFKGLWLTCLKVKLTTFYFLLNVGNATSN